MPSSAPSEVLPLNEDSFVIDLKETENNLLHFSLTGLPALDEIGDEEVSNSLEGKDSSANSAHVPLISRMFENLIGERSLFATSPGPAALAVNSSAGDKRSSKAAELEISLLEVAQHDSFSDCWVVIYDRVYDITDFLHSHPGGYDVILEHAGHDATFAFRGSGHSVDAVQMLKRFEIGILPMEERLYRHETPIFRWGELPE